MAKVYVDDVGTTLIVDTNIDLTSASTMRLKVLPPDLVEETWVCSDSGTPTDGLIDHQVGVDLDTPGGIATTWGTQTGTWTFQAEVTFAGGLVYLGETFTISVFAAFA